MPAQEKMRNKPVCASATSVTSVSQKATFTVGPIPPAASLEEYRSVRPDLPDLIIGEWLKEAESRRELERREFALAERNLALKEKISRDINRLEYFRLGFGILFSCGALLLAWWFASNNHIESALAMSALPVIAAIASAGIKLFRKK